MPELLLSSAPVKKLSTDSLLNSSTRSGNAFEMPSKNPADEGVTRVKKEGEFNNILSSIVKNPNSEGADPSVETDLADLSQSILNQSIDDLSQSIDDLMNEFSKLDPDSEVLTDIRNFLDGQDISTLSLENIDDGASLPEFLSDFKSLISSMLDSVDEVSGLSWAESLDAESATALQALFTQFNMVASELSNKVGVVPQASAEPLLGFTFNGSKDRGQGHWQEYDPQQMSKPLDGAQNGNTQTTSVSQNGQMQGLVTDRLVSETDKHFKTQVEQLVSENTSTDTLSEVLLDTKDKLSVKFADLQLRTANETLKQYSTTLSTPVSSQQWSEDVSQKVVWFTGRNIQAAEMHLNPADLGPIDVKIHVQNDVASVTFNVNNASVRDLLESNVVRLREMMESNGVNVGEVNIGSGSREQSQQSGSDSENNAFGESSQGMEDDSERIANEQELNIKQTNLVDYFV